MLCGQSCAVGASCAPDTLDDVPSFWVDVTLFLSVLPFPAPGGGWVSGQHAAHLVDGFWVPAVLPARGVVSGEWRGFSTCLLRVSAAVPVGPRGCTQGRGPRTLRVMSHGASRCCCVLGHVMWSLALEAGWLRRAEPAGTGTCWSPCGSVRPSSALTSEPVLHQGTCSDGQWGCPQGSCPRSTSLQGLAGQA